MGDKPVDVTTDPSVVASDQTEQTSEETPKFDFESFNRRLTEVSESAASKADVEAAKRAAGHVPALQSKIAALEAEVAQSKVDADRLSALELLVLDVLPADRAEEIQAQRTRRDQEAALDERFGSIQERLDALARPQSAAVSDDVLDPRIAAYEAAAAEATSAIHAYAIERGIDPTEIPAEVYTTAQAQAEGDLLEAAKSVTAWVDQQAEAQNSSARRAQRAEDARGGDPAARAGAAGQYDLTTVAGLSQARAAGAITSDTFIEGYRKLRGGI